MSKEAHKILESNAVDGGEYRHATLFVVALLVGLLVDSLVEYFFLTLTTPVITDSCDEKSLVGLMVVLLVRVLCRVSCLQGLKPRSRPA